MCIVCELGRSPTREEIKGDILNISWCKNVTMVKVPEGIRELFCYGCTGLTDLGGVKNPLPESLQVLCCSGCTGLTNLGGVKNPFPKNLLQLFCTGCTSLTDLGGVKNPLPESLQLLYCNGCTGLTELGGVKNPLPKSLQGLYCVSCIGFTELILPEGLQYLDCYNCTKLTRVEPQNVIDNLSRYIYSTWMPSEYLEDNLKKLRTLQRFCRTIPTRKLLRLSKTRKFCEWFYHPENYGGRWAKVSLMRLVSIGRSATS